MSTECHDCCYQLRRDLDALAAQVATLTTGRQHRAESIADTIRLRIRRGVYPPGSDIPPQATLAREFNASAATVSAAMTLLRHDGLVLDPGAGPRRLRVATKVPP